MMLQLQCQLTAIIIPEISLNLEDAEGLILNFLLTSVLWYKEDIYQY